MHKEELARYLKFGFARTFEYGETVETIEIGWSEAKEKFLELYQASFKKFPGNSLAFCGGLASCMNLSYMDKNIPTLSVELGVNTKELSEKFNAENFLFEIKNVERSLIEMVKIWDEPRCCIEDVLAFARQGGAKPLGFSEIYCEGGTDYLLMGGFDFFNLMKFAMLKGDYKVDRALHYGGKKLEKIRLESSILNKTYMEHFLTGNYIFDDKELYDFGLPAPKVSLKQDTIQDFTKALFEWGRRSVDEDRTKKLGDYFGIRSYSPFFNDKEMIKFCLSLPIEMKYCLGRGRHILKEAVKIPKLNLVHRIYPNIYKVINEEFQILIEKYVKNKKSKMYDLIDFDVAQRHINNRKKCWALLNLEIWLEERE